MRRDFIARSGLPVLFEWEALRPKDWRRGVVASMWAWGPVLWPHRWRGRGAPSQLPHGGGIPSPFGSLCWGFWKMMADSQWEWSGLPGAEQGTESDAGVLQGLTTEVVGKPQGHRPEGPGCQLALAKRSGQMPASMIPWNLLGGGRAQAWTQRVWWCNDG